MLFFIGDAGDTPTCSRVINTVVEPINSHGWGAHHNFVCGKESSTLKTAEEVLLTLHIEESTVTQHMETKLEISSGVKWKLVTLCNYGKIGVFHYK